MQQPAAELGTGVEYTSRGFWSQLDPMMAAAPEAHKSALLTIVRKIVPQIGSIGNLSPSHDLVRTRRNNAYSRGSRTSYGQ
jgi:hypothetical protein